MKCCICKKDFADGFQDDSGNLYCSEKCFQESLPRCYICHKKMDNFITFDGNKYCSKECMKYKEPFNYALKIIIEHRLKCLDYLPISAKGKELLQKYIDLEALYMDAVTIGKEKGMVSDRDIANSISCESALIQIGLFHSSNNPGMFSSEADLKIYAFKLVSMKARVEYVESLLKIIFEYENVGYVKSGRIVDYKQIVAKKDNLKRLEEKYREQRNSLFKAMAGKSGVSESEIATILKGSMTASASYLTKGAHIAGLGGGTLATGLSIPLGGLIAAGSLLFYLYNRKNRIIAEGIAEAQALYTQKLDEMHNDIGSWIARSNSKNQEMDNRLRELNEEIVASEIAIAQYKLDIVMFNEVEKLNN